MGVIDNLGFIAQANWFPCEQAEGKLILEAVGNAAGITLLHAASFGCLDILKMRAGISPWHARGMRAMIDGAIPPEQAGLAKGLLKFSIPLEKALFFWFVVDLTTEFAANWQSQMFKLGACAEQPNTCNFSGQHPMWLSIPLGHWNPVSYFDTHGSAECHFDLRGSIEVAPHCFYSLFFDFSVAPLNPRFPVKNVYTRVRRVNNNPFTFAERNNEPGWVANPLIAGYLQKGENKAGTHSVYVMEAMSQEECVATSGTVSATISNLPIFKNNILPVNCLGQILPGHELGNP